MIKVREKKQNQFFLLGCDLKQRNAVAVAAVSICSVAYDYKMPNSACAYRAHISWNGHVFAAMNVYRMLIYDHAIYAENCNNNNCNIRRRRRRRRKNNICQYGLVCWMHNYCKQLLLSFVFNCCCFGGLRARDCDIVLRLFYFISFYIYLFLFRKRSVYVCSHTIISETQDWLERCEFNAYVFVWAILAHFQFEHIF